MKDSRGVQALVPGTGEFRLVDSFVVRSGDRLILKNGTRIRSNKGLGIVLDGGLLSVLGFLTDPVRLYGDQAVPGYWMGIWGRPESRVAGKILIEACEMRDVVCGVFLRFYAQEQAVRFSDARNYLLAGLEVVGFGLRDEVHRNVAVHG